MANRNKKGKDNIWTPKKTYNPKYLRIVKFKSLILFFLSFLCYQIDFQFISHTHTHTHTHSLPIDCTNFNWQLAKLDNARILKENKSKSCS